MYTLENDCTQPDDFIDRLPTQPEMERVNLLTAPIPVLLRRFHVDTLPSVDSYQTARVATVKKKKKRHSFDLLIILTVCLLLSFIIFLYLLCIYLIVTLR